MKLREALLSQSPSLALQRAAADEIARLDGKLAELHHAALDFAYDVEVVSSTDVFKTIEPKFAKLCKVALGP